MLGFTATEISAPHRHAVLVDRDFDILLTIESCGRDLDLVTVPAIHDYCLISGDTGGRTPATDQQLVEQLVEDLVEIIEWRSKGPGHVMTSP